jgi:RecB family exonuclease
MYKHHDELVPKREKRKALKRGSWFHSLLEAHYKGESVTAEHKRLCAEYAELWAEEKDALGDLPHDMSALFKAYKWHYSNDTTWRILEVEHKIEATLPNGLPYQGKCDLIVEDEFGKWVVDHKTHGRTLPSMDYRYRDPQSTFYIWACRENGIEVLGHIWNYVIAKAPQPLKFTKTGRLYKKQPFTDWPTAVKGLKAEGVDPADYSELLDDLYHARFDPDAVQTSPVFRRDVFEKRDDTIDRVIAELARTAMRYAEYDFEDRDTVERAPERACDWCSYRVLCLAEMLDRNAENVRRREFKHGDPLEYYGPK